MQKKIFEDFIQEYFPERTKEILVSFELYWKLLQLENKKVNLISRKTLSDDLWTIHFLDSILIAKYYNLSNLKILDFGTGGGLPGIPIKIVFPESIVYLLDSKKKKTRSINEIVKKLDLNNCFIINSRLEELGNKWSNFFDIIISRSVKILPEYKKDLFRLLRKNGKLLLYKSKKLNDVLQFPQIKIYDITHPSIGERKIIEITK